MQSSGEDRDHDHDEVLAAMPPDVAKAFRQMRERYGKRLDEGLQDPQVAELFVRDPIQALRKLGMEVPPQIARYGARMRQAQKLSFSYRLPNGQVIRPRVNIRFHGGA